MDIDVALDLVLIRGRDEKKIAHHLLALLREHEGIDVCKSLIAAVDTESLDPKVFSIFLSATKDIDSILLCLRQPYSLFVRRQAIKQYGKAIGDVERWEEAWRAIGDTAGILQYLSEVSVWEVKRFFQSLGNSIRGRLRPARRSQAVEALLMAMYPALFPETSIKTSDKRPLEKFAIPLVSACSEVFIRRLIDEEEKNQLYLETSKPKLISTHGKMVLDYTVRYAFTKEKNAFTETIDFYLTQFTSTDAPIPSEEPKLSASMAFSERLLKTRLERPNDPWPGSSSETDVYFSLLKRCRDKKVSKSREHELLSLGMQLLESKKDFGRDFSRRESEFWTSILTYWIKWPNQWEDLFIQGLQNGLGGTPQNIPGAFDKIANRSKFKRERTWPMLRLLCLHVLKNGIDLDQATDLKPLAKQRWNVQVFRKLPEDKSVHLLKLLLRVNQNVDFMQGGSHNSILSQQSVYDQHNFNVLLLLTEFQLRSEDVAQREQAQERVRRMLEDLRKKAASSREQTERANYAQAAGFAAIASGSLDVFGGFVEWLQRFIRDPLTVKVVFSAFAIASHEASNLLCGIPDAHFEKDVSLSEVSSRVSKANEILLKFHSHKQVAKREPSYQQRDWNGVSTLLQNSIKTRITRARKLQKGLDASDGELYSAIWSQTFAMFSQVGAESMAVVQHEMQSLMNSLPPKTLATTTEAMLKTDDSYRATKSAGREAEDESHIIQSLSYQCLLTLAKGDKPALAQDLIVRTIIERPDASSWHRQMLSISFFKRLPAKNAEQLLLGFAQAIGEKLEEQSYVRLGEPSGTASIVKVTTVKYLAQLLQDAQFLSPDAAIDVLLELFKVATHPDIRFATLESMLATLNSLCASELRGPVTKLSEIKNPLIHKILAALDAVVPVVGSVNERRPPREQDWAEANEDLKLLPEPSSSPMRPLWEALLNSARASTTLKSYFVERLLLPIIETSIKEHTKWLALFLRKYNASVGPDDLPPVPLDPHMLEVMVSTFTTLIPAELLSRLDVYVRFLLSPSPALKRFNTRLKSDEENRNKVEVKHFLSVFDRGTDDVLRNTTHQLINLVHHGWQPSTLPKTVGVTLEQSQNIILSHVNVTIDRYDELLHDWNGIVEKLRHHNGMSDKAFKSWRKDCRPLLQQVVQMVEGKRTPEWKNNPERQPTALPTTFKLQLWLLDYPEPVVTDVAISSRQSAKLADQLLGWLRARLDYVGRFEDVINEVSTITSRLTDFEILRIAVVLGSFEHNDRQKPQEELLRVSLAKQFLDYVGKDRVRKESEKHADLRSSLRTMVVESWEKSPVEDIRNVCFEWRMKDRGFYNITVKPDKDQD